MCASKVVTPKLVPHLQTPIMSLNGMDVDKVSEVKSYVVKIPRFIILKIFC